MPHDSQSENNKKLVALVDGDVTVDWHIATDRAPSESTLWHKPEERVPVVSSLGGAALLGELIARLAAKGLNPKWQVVYRNKVSEKNADFPRLYSVWYLYDRDTAGQAWRISKFLGRDLPSTPSIPELLPTEAAPDLIIIDDKGHLFRREPTWWNRTIAQSDQNSWFLIRAGRPLEDNGIWPELRNAKAKVIAVTTVDDIRLKEVFVSRRLSWELTAQDLYDEILENKNPALSQFSGCDFIIVCFTASAVVVIENVRRASNAAAENETEKAHCWLIYDPASLEDEEWRDPQRGRIQGYTYCVIAAITHYLFHCLPGRPEATKLNDAIKNGLTASRNLYEKGFEKNDDGISFPFDRVVREVTDHSDGAWGVAQVPARASTNDWTLFERQAFQDYGSLNQLAKQIVREGLDELRKKLPFYKAEI